MIETFSLHNYYYFHPHEAPKKGPYSKIKRGFKKSTKIQKVAYFIALAGVFLIVLSYLPYGAYSIRMRSRDPFSGSSGQKVAEKKVYEPAFDSTLTTQSIVTIPSIGVSTLIREASYETHEDVFKLGVWRVQDFGVPNDRSEPVILAAHRFGYLRWDNEYRRLNSFYNLPKLVAGDTVEITWRQRRYVYGIYAVVEDEKITDYSADLILYTCRDLTSDVRVVAYARLLEI